MTELYKYFTSGIKRVDTVGGWMVYRDDYDLEVINEVVDRLEYFRWGDITVKPGDTVIDAGAHIGSFTRLALSMGASVIAIEPNDDNFKYLMANTEGAQNLKLVQAVLWNGKDTHFLNDPERNELHKVATGGDLVPTSTLDDILFLFEVDKVDLLKMDIEGAEYEVLYNASPGTLKKIQQISMEWHYGSTNLAHLIIFLEENGFKVVWLGGNGQWGKLQCKRAII